MLDTPRCFRDIAICCGVMKQACRSKCHTMRAQTSMRALLHVSPLAPPGTVLTCKPAFLPLVATLAGFLVLRLPLLACCDCSLASASAPAAWRTLRLPAQTIELAHAVFIIILGHSATHLQHPLRYWPCHCCQCEARLTGPLSPFQRFPCPAEAQQTQSGASCSEIVVHDPLT